MLKLLHLNFGVENLRSKFWRTKTSAFRKATGEKFVRNRLMKLIFENEQLFSHSYEKNARIYVDEIDSRSQFHQQKYARIFRANVKKAARFKKSISPSFSYEIPLRKSPFAVRKSPFFVCQKKHWRFLPPRKKGMPWKTSKLCHCIFICWK